ncbi:MAG: hypothetical protein ACTHOH_04380 [Lysobacteraceae bacterium]
MRILDCTAFPLVVLACLLFFGARTAFAAPKPAPILPAPADGASGPVMAIVEVPRPWYVPDALIVRKMRATLPQYRALPGLRFKAYSFARPGGDFGGVYLWRDRAAAEAWFTPAWFERVRRERGVEGRVRLFALSESPSFASDVSDWGAFPHAVVVVVAGTGDAARSIPGRAGFPSLRTEGALALYPIRTADGPGAAVLWRDAARARAWLARNGFGKGSAARVAWFDTPLMTTAGEQGAAPVIDAVATPGG